ncbi:MAG: hypothetical protein V1906_01315 [Candidatus Woesearchaeota archaeon]
MLTPYLIERAFYRLENNLINNDEVKSYYAPKFEMARKNLPDCLDSLSIHLSLYGKEFMPFELLQKASFIPLNPFKKQFNLRNGVIPYPLGLVLEKNDWKKFKKFMGVEKWAAGLYYGKLFFNRFNLVPELASLGMIFLGNYSGRDKFEIVEHECLHSCFEKHSAGLSFVSDMHYSPDLEFHQIAYIMEARMMNELIAYQDNFRNFFETWGIKGTLKGRYIDRHVKLLKGMYDKKATLPIRLRHYMHERISRDVKHLSTIVKALPRRIRTPLLLGMGPTSGEIQMQNLKSSLDDIIIWSSMVQDYGLMQKAKTILNAKGYS